jgi:hypothetical protein
MANPQLHEKQRFNNKPRNRGVFFYLGVTCLD